MEITESAHREELHNAFESLLEKIKESYNTRYHNFTGDGYAIVGDSPNEMAQAALTFRDYFRNKEWQKIGFPIDVALRIALHVGVVEFNKPANTLLAGSNSMNYCARLEPLADPNQVVCSSHFYRTLCEQLGGPNNGRVLSHTLGRKALPKGAGLENLVELLWRDDMPPRAAPKSKISASDAEVKRLVDNLNYRFDPRAQICTDHQKKHALLINNKPELKPAGELDLRSHLDAEAYSRLGNAIRAKTKAIVKRKGENQKAYAVVPG